MAKQCKSFVPLISRIVHTPPSLRARLLARGEWPRKNIRDPDLVSQRSKGSRGRRYWIPPSHPRTNKRLRRPERRSQSERYREAAEVEKARSDPLFEFCRRSEKESERFQEEKDPGGRLARGWLIRLTSTLAKTNICYTCDACDILVLQEECSLPINNWCDC